MKIALASFLLVSAMLDSENAAVEAKKKRNPARKRKTKKKKKKKCDVDSEVGDCPDGQYCGFFVNLGTGLCRPYSQAGEPCGGINLSDGECEDPLGCVYFTDTFSFLDFTPLPGGPGVCKATCENECATDEYCGQTLETAACRPYQAEGADCGPLPDLAAAITAGADELLCEPPTFCLFPKDSNGNILLEGATCVRNEDPIAPNNGPA